jgi:hypothetical protein
MALKQRLSTPSNPPHMTVVDPSLRGCNSSPSQFPSTVVPEGPGPDGTDVADDVVDFAGTVSPPCTPHRPVNNNFPQATHCRSIDPSGVLPDNSTFALLSGHFGSGLGGPTVHIASPPRDAQGANARAAHMAGPAGGNLPHGMNRVPMRMRHIWQVPRVATSVQRPPTLHPVQSPGHLVSPLPHTPLRVTLQTLQWFVRRRPVLGVNS